jgi:adenosylcobinamide-GDP ribazoletransferase
MCLKAITALLQFTTILPVGKPVPFEHFARQYYLFPVAGYVIGILASVCIAFIPSQPIAAAVAIAVVFLITGAHHFDGLVDLGDALLAHGTAEKRIRALTDPYVGAGGLALGISLVLVTFAALQGLRNIVFAMIIAEVCAKFAMSLLTSYGKPFREGIHSYLHGFSKIQYPVYSAVLCLPLLLLPVPRIQILAAASIAFLCPLGMLYTGNRLFGGVNGDIVGAANEITRTLVFLGIALVASFSA